METRKDRLVSLANAAMLALWAMGLMLLAACSSTSVASQDAAPAVQGDDKGMTTSQSHEPPEGLGGELYDSTYENEFFDIGFSVPARWSASLYPNSDGTSDFRSSPKKDMANAGASLHIETRRVGSSYEEDGVSPISDIADESGTTEFCGRTVDWDCALQSGQYLKRYYIIQDGYLCTISMTQNSEADDHKLVDDLEKYVYQASVGPVEVDDLDMVDDESSWHTLTTTVKTADGYEIEETLNLSPWIDSSNDEAINAAWARARKSSELFPTVVDFSFDTTTEDIVYAIGTIAAHNTSDGFEISEYSSQSPDFDIRIKHASEDVKALFFYNTNTKRYWVQSPYLPNLQSGTHTKPTAKMVHDDWGTVPIVIGVPNPKTPNIPDGIDFGEVLVSLGDDEVTLGLIGPDE